MSQTFNAKKSVVALLALLMACTALVAVMSEDSEAAGADIKIGTPVAADFADNHAGTLSFGIANNSNLDVTITVVAMEGTNTLATKEYKLTATEKSADGKISFQIGSGDHTISLVASAVETGTTNVIPVDVPSVPVTVHVDTSFWSGWVPYVVLVVVALVAVLMIYMWSRGRPKKAAAVSFSDLEEGKVAAPAAPADTGRKKYEAEPKQEEKPAGRVKYVSDRRK